MADKFEDSIKQFYDKERIANTKLLNLSEEPEVFNRDLGNNIDFAIKNIILLSRVTIKHFHTIHERQQKVERRLQSCEDLITKIKRETQEELKAIKEELQANKPLTKTEVLSLVKEISQQPKLVKEQALLLTSKLDEKIDKVDKLIQHLVTWTS